MKFITEKAQIVDSLQNAAAGAHWFNVSVALGGGSFFPHLDVFHFLTPDPRKYQRENATAIILVLFSCRDLSRRARLGLG